MANFVTRIELHAASWDDYNDLHARMEAKGFQRTIPSGNGEQYELPTATYYVETGLTADQVATHAREAANATGKSNSVITTQGPSSFFLNKA
ncbi:type V toxin-antitoxin system endoribonuclease antitoxin GhoS [Burkholderia cenocepacia]|nr:type V toxin-antitoxin system endoribonuclease antitoxin GhoS [Burkholderia cenocepacia]MBJ9897394.1 type V toxin-antitoxin system endoribonuclease antitoxin GhoS [Burkholderia cenocepacia]MBJ9913967.1 type V toxin-antitoxin system endoribonuclease antitoxin GhoS [Burkholderia cenocepacia]MBR8097670.1 type V toxin-antitoxin system endoribonuclease antitoxin GhoS [Burkholderia cenocepacia]MDI9683553.1 type V toxin-antitoxin system endoribonuclease antitoxin GhoS [Burkholderia cenocepacia]HEP